MAILIVEPPIEEPITLDEAKLHCRVDVDDDDTLITGLISAARAYAEAIEWRAYLTQTIELHLDAWPSGNQIELPRPPLQSVTSIVYTGEDGTEHTVDADTYVVDTAREPGRIALKSGESWPSETLQVVDGIVITYLAGWEFADDVSAMRKQALLLLVGHWYENRETATLGAVSHEIDFAVKALLGIDHARTF